MKATTEVLCENAVILIRAAGDCSQFKDTCYTAWLCDACPISKGYDLMPACGLSFYIPGLREQRVTRAKAYLASVPEQNTCGSIYYEY